MGGAGNARPVTQAVRRSDRMGELTRSIAARSSGGKDNPRHECQCWATNRRRTLSKREAALSVREISASGLARSCSTLDRAHLRGVGRGHSFSFGVEVTPNFLGGWNELEDSKNCRSAGGHGNQHVRLRSAQIDRIEATGPARSEIPASSRGRLVRYPLVAPARKSYSQGKCGDRPSCCAL